MTGRTTEQQAGPLKAAFYKALLANLDGLLAESVEAQRAAFAPVYAALKVKGMHIEYITKDVADTLWLAQRGHHPKAKRVRGMLKQLDSDAESARLSAVPKLDSLAKEIGTDLRGLFEKMAGKTQQEKEHKAGRQEQPGGRPRGAQSGGRRTGFASGFSDEDLFSRRSKESSSGPRGEESRSGEKPWSHMSDAEKDAYAEKNAGRNTRPQGETEEQRQRREANEAWANKQNQFGQQAGARRSAYDGCTESSDPDAHMAAFYACMEALHRDAESMGFGAVSALLKNMVIYAQSRLDDAALGVLKPIVVHAEKAWRALSNNDAKRLCPLVAELGFLAGREDAVRSLIDGYLRKHGAVLEETDFRDFLQGARAAGDYWYSMRGAGDEKKFRAFASFAEEAQSAAQEAKRGLGENEETREALLDLGVTCCAKPSGWTVKNLVSRAAAGDPDFATPERLFHALDSAKAHTGHPELVASGAFCAAVFLREKGHDLWSPEVGATVQALDARFGHLREVRELVEAADKASQPVRYNAVLDRSAIPIPMPA